MRGRPPRSAARCKFSLKHERYTSPNTRLRRFETVVVASMHQSHLEEYSQPPGASQSHVDSSGNRQRSDAQTLTCALDPGCGSCVLDREQSRRSIAARVTNERWVEAPGMHIDLAPRGTRRSGDGGPSEGHSESNRDARAPPVRRYANRMRGLPDRVTGIVRENCKAKLVTTCIRRAKNRESHDSLRAQLDSFRRDKRCPPASQRARRIRPPQRGVVRGTQRSTEHCRR